LTIAWSPGKRWREGAREKARDMGTAIPPNTAQLTAWSAAAATGGRLRLAREAGPAQGVVSDSRSVTPGCAFVALRGALHDGHDYVDSAVAAGAVLLILEKGRKAVRAPVDVVEVDDTLVAWGDLARAHLRAWRRSRRDVRCFAITGSAGKTTTKELCAALLRSLGGCHATAGNLNNRVGVPAVAFGVAADHRFAVFELGMSLPGEIARLGDIVEPDVAILTNVGVAHAEGVGGSRFDVAREKGDLFAGLSPGAVAIVCADDVAAFGQLARSRAGQSVTFGASVGADYRLLDRRAVGLDGSDVRVLRRFDSTEVRVRLPLVGEAAAIDFCAALAAVESVARLDDDVVSRALRLHFRRPAGRLHVRRLANGTTLLDDTYNANPQSFRAAFQALAELAEGRPAVIVVGEMKELGAIAPSEHVSLGPLIVRAGARLAVSCGGLADAAVHAAREAGIEVALGADAEEAASLATSLVNAGDVVLVKASRGVGAECVVEALVRAGGGEVNLPPES
jgi:UDP-N-acetylmuramoyl-tripeptide--D-alanyl-D-alanine ligase